MDKPLLVIWKSSNGNGDTFALSDNARRLLEAKRNRPFKGNGRMFLSADPTPPNDLQMQAAISIITTLSAEEQEEFRIEIRDPAKEPD